MVSSALPYIVAALPEMRNRQKMRGSCGAKALRSSGFERADPILVKESAKRLDPKDCARLLAWLAFCGPIPSRVNYRLSVACAPSLR